MEFAMETIGAWFTAKLTRTRPLTPRRIPGTSNRVQQLPSDLCIFARSIDGSTRMASAAKAMQVAAMVQNAHGHSASMAKRLDITAPTTNPAGAAAPNSDMTIFFRGPEGKPSPALLWPFGTGNAGPMPCIALLKQKKTLPWPPAA